MARKHERGMKEPDQGVSHAAGSPVDERFETLDARIRHKLDVGLPLTAEERAFFANVPGSKEIPPKAVQEGKLDVEHQ